jgi:hypothetical protein
MLDQGEKIDHQTFPIYEPGLLDDLVHKAIDEYVFRDVDQELVNACRVLALLRQFDVILLRRVLSRFVSDFKDYPRAAYGGLLGLLHTTQVIEWDDGRKGYNVAMPLRQILSQHMRQHNPRQYIAINQAALEVYHDWIKRVSENRSVYIIEAVYHQAVINRVSAPQATEPADIVQQFRAYLERCYTLENYADDRDLLDGALDRLEQELKRDDELISLLEGLEIPVETLHQIIADHHKH